MEENKENVVEEITQQETPVKEEPVLTTKEEPVADNTVEKLKVKEKPSMKKFSNDPDSVVKVDLNNPPKAEVEETQDIAPAQEDEKKVETDGVEDTPEETTDQPALEEITDKETEDKVEELQEQVEEAIVEAETTGKELPENIQKLINFMEETGGDLEDYVALKRDYDKYDDASILMEYYMHTKPHLTEEEVRFTLEDQFSWDEDVDDEIEVKRKKLALKEQVASARAGMDRLKSEYYGEIKAGSKLTKEQQKAVDFFNRYNKESKENSEVMQENQKIFIDKTNNVFNDKFKGFEYNVGDKKFRFNVKDVDSIKKNQSDLSNFVEKFLSKKNQLEDAVGYHKSLFTAMNPDTIANHFYEQGKADALKESVSKAKNVDMTPRQSHGEIEAGGIKVKVLGDTADDFKFKIKRK